MKKALTALGILAAVAVGVFAIGVFNMFGEQIRAMNSLSQVKDNVYTFEYKGDYGFRQLLEEGGRKTDAEIGDFFAAFMSKGYMKVNATTPDGGCSTITDGNLFGRNFDWDNKGNYVIVRTYPEDGYASISTSSFTFIGFGNDWRPAKTMDKMVALASIYIPLDGMNEMGLCVADLVEIDGSSEILDTEKPDLTITTAIRLLLDYAKDTDEAIELLSGYDVFTAVNLSHHLAISDRKGNNVVVEWNNGNMTVTPSDIVTNHCLAEEREHPFTGDSKKRFGILSECKPGIGSSNDILQALKDVSYMNTTLWSIVYDKTNLTGSFHFEYDWDNPVNFSL